VSRQTPKAVYGQNGSPSRSGIYNITGFNVEADRFNAWIQKNLGNDPNHMVPKMQETDAGMSGYNPHWKRHQSGRGGRRDALLPGVQPIRCLKLQDFSTWIVLNKLDVPSNQGYLPLIPDTSRYNLADLAT